MGRRRHTPEQIVRELREADRLLGWGADVADAAWHLEVSEATYPPRRHIRGGSHLRNPSGDALGLKRWTRRSETNSAAAHVVGAVTDESAILSDPAGPERERR